ncbi:hypothetical protein F4801DRAFT_2403 [Xylaria longipes]|nr:hypothetical protein F4801DRAFT_2403 [Xylaria longipes]
MHGPRGGANHMTPTSPGLGESTNDHNPQQRRRGPRRYRGRGSKHHHHHRPHTRKPESSHSYGDSYSVPQCPRQPIETLTLGLYPRTFDKLHAERQDLLNALQAQDSRALELFRQLPAVESDIDHYRNIEHRHQHPHQQHDRYRDINTNVKVKVDGIPVNEINDRARLEAVEENQERLQTAQRQRLWLRQQVEATVNAERNILMRLGELHVETRCRERWCQVEWERSEMLYASEPGYAGFRPGYTPYQQSQGYPNPDQNSPLHPDMYLSQADCHGYNDVNAGYSYLPTIPPSYLHPGSSAIFSGYDCSDQQNHAEFAQFGAQDCGPPSGRADGGDGMWQPASCQRGQEYHVRETDGKWMGEDMSDCKRTDWPLGLGNPPNMRRWSFPSVDYEVSNVGVMFFLPWSTFTRTKAPALAMIMY